MLIAKANFPKRKIAMSTNTVKESDIQEVPFFARFLQEQSASEDPDTPDTPDTPAPDATPPPPWTIKFPSDFEDC